MLRGRYDPTTAVPSSDPFGHYSTQIEFPCPLSRRIERNNRSIVLRQSERIITIFLRRRNRTEKARREISGGSQSHSIKGVKIDFSRLNGIWVIKWRTWRQGRTGTSGDPAASAVAGRAEIKMEIDHGRGRRTDC